MRRCILALSLAVLASTARGATGQSTGKAPLAATDQDVSGRLVKSTGSTTNRALKDRFADVVSVRDYGATGDGATDDTAAIQAALNTGKPVRADGGTFKITASLYMNTSGQEFAGTGTIAMSAALGKPALYLGATDAAGTPPVSSAVNMRVRGLRFLGSGTRTAGSAGVAFVKATTATVDSVYAWNFYAGITVLGQSIVNTVINPDLRGNMVGFYDPSTDPTVSDFQAGQVIGGRIENSSNEGVIVGSPNVKFIGTTIEGNGTVAYGGDGTKPEVTITGGVTGGSVHFVDCYFESSATKTADAVIEIPAGTVSRYVHLIGGEFYANGAAGRYIVKTSSTSTTQAVRIAGGTFTGFKNYVAGTFANNSGVSVDPTWTDAARNVTADATFSGGGAYFQRDRADGVRTNQASAFANISSPRLTSTAASGDAGIVFPTGVRLELGGTRQIWSDGTNINVGSSGINVTLGGASSSTALVGQLRIGGTGPIIFAGTGAPTGDAPIGSLYLRTDGGAATSLYVKEVAGAGGANWGAK